MKTGVFAILCALLFVACGPAGRSSSFSDEIADSQVGIFGGNPVGSDQIFAESTLEIRFLKDNQPENCTATRIRPRVLLTAAHCAQASELHIYQRGSRMATLTPNDVMVHPLYEAHAVAIKKLQMWGEANEYDIAILFLPETVLVRPNVPVFSLAPAKVYLRDKLYVLGYGYAELNLMTGERQGRTNLKIAELESDHSSQNGILIFSQKNEQGICVGDSGGPAFLFQGKTPMLVGIASDLRNPGQALICRGISRFVRIRSVLPWILETLKSR